MPCDTKKKKKDELPAAYGVPRWCGPPPRFLTGRIRVAMVRALRRAKSGSAASLAWSGCFIPTLRIRNFIAEKRNLKTHETSWIRRMFGNW